MRRTSRVLVISGLVFAAFHAPAGAAGGPCGPPVVNPVACENTLPGDPPSDWNVQGAGDPTIQGYATSFSVNVGQTVYFKIDTPSTSYHIDILRLGYYGGDGARKVASNIKPTATLPQTQPSCLTDSSTGLIDCGNWSVSASWSVPSTAVSGVYIAHLVRDDSKDPGGDSQIPFVVRNDASHSAILVSTSDATWEAYNNYGGNSLYDCSVACPPGNPGGYKAAYAVSYNRPFDGALTTDNGASYLYYAEYQMIRFLEENGYDVSYTSSADVDRAGSLLLNHKLFVSSGHDEYWSAGQRANVTAARDDGVNLAFFSGNEVFWKTRWANSEDGSNTPYRTLITYKETHFDSPVDPADPPTWTGSWTDPRFSPPADGGNPPNSLTGQDFVVNAGTADITVPSTYSKVRLWRNTSVASLASGQSVTLGNGDGTLGYEWDVDADNGFRPPGEFDLSSTTVSGLQTFTDYGTNVVNGTTETHHLTLYRASSGALVFGAGTVQWAWGLDNTNAWQESATDPSGNPPDRNMQQATVNLFADMGAQPATLMSGLTAASPSTDTTPPTSRITSPAANANLQDGNQVTVSGTATDAGGGVVAGVEVSADGGSTWHPATISGSDASSVTWTYSWVAHGNPTTTIETRAVDDSGNLETPSDSETVNVACPCSIFGTGMAPPVADSGDGSSIEVGMKFTSSAYGQVTGLRFYKASTNTGTHVGSLWTASGTLLASGTFTGETASGWQTLTFSSPVTITPNTTYVVGYLAPKGHYSGTTGYFFPAPSPPPTGGGDYISPPLSAVPNNTSANGLYSYTTSSTFPTSSYQASNYWVDPIFVPIPSPGPVTGVSGTAGFDSATITWSAPTTGGSVTSYIVTPYIGSAAQTPTTVTGNPPATGVTITGLQQGTAYTFTVAASNPNGSGPASSPSNQVTPTGPTSPGAPTGVSAIPASAQALVSWTAPPNNGSSITGYTVTPYIGSSAQTPFQVTNGSATSATVTGLKNNTAYTFTVSATNSLGTGPASSPSPATTPEDTIFDFSTPATQDSGDTSSVELGVKFTADTSGQITGIRFYKSAANTGTHVGSLWTASGTLLASGTFTGETASGWQTLLFSSPVTITPGTTYVAGYLDPAGHYSATTAGLSSSVDNPPLHAVGNGTSANGVFIYSATSAFPTSTYQSNNYWVDVLFAPTPPSQVTGVTATAGHSAATVSWTAPSSGGVTSYTITPYIGSTAQTPTTITGTPPATTVTINGLTPGTAYTFTVQAGNSTGSGPASSPSNSVTPTAPTGPGAPTGVTASPATGQALVSWTAAPANGNALTSYTVTPYIGTTAQTPTVVNNGSATSATVKGLTNGTAYTFTVSATNGLGTGPASTATSAITPEDTIFDFATPATLDSGDTSAVTLGVKFTADVTGQISGVRFYKSAANTGTHIGSLWNATGGVLASGTFTGETASGWQTLVFSSPVTITAGTTYVAGYFAPAGHYSVNPGGLNSAADNPPLHAIASGGTGNGVYAYGSSSTFPANSYNASNYWVDVLFAPAVPGAVSGVSATAGMQSATVSWTDPTTGGAPSGYTVTPYIGTTAQTPTAVNSGTATSATVSGLTAGTAYTFTVQATNAYGAGPASAKSNAVTPSGPGVPSAPTAVAASPASGQALVSWTAPASNGSPISSYTVTPYIGSTAQAATIVNNGSATSATITGLTNNTAYTFTVSATNGLGTGPASAASPATTPEDTIFDFNTPSIVDAGDTSSVELGVKLTVDVSGQITGIRFYKAPTNTGTHIGSLWTTSGTLLASGTFTGETASGWQTLLFSSPVNVTTGTTYVAGYFAPNGHYSSTPAGLSSPFDNPPLHAVSNTTSANGVYAYSSTSTFPTSTYNATNYWVDVLFNP